MYFLVLRGRSIPVTNMVDASHKFRVTVDVMNLGASNLSNDDGTIHDDRGQNLGYISYNGKVWTADGKLAYNPYAEKVTL